MRALPIALALALLLGTPAPCGLLDSPPPSVESAVALRVVFRMGAIYYEPDRVDTVVTCTNEDAAPIEIAFEIFDMNDARAGALTSSRVAPGRSVSFTTSSGAGPEGRVVVPGLGALAYGKARVSATSVKLACSGSWRARLPDGTTKDSPLQLVKRVAFGDRR